jgi:hypothetical protein
MSEIERLEAEVAEAERAVEEADAEVERITDELLAVEVDSTYSWPVVPRVTLR